MKKGARMARSISLSLVTILLFASGIAGAQQAPLSSILFPPEYVFSGPDLRTAIIVPGGFGKSSVCTAGICIEHPGPSNDNWRHQDLRLPTSFEAVAGLKILFVRFGDAYRPIAKIRVVPLRPFTDSIRVSTHLSVVSSIKKDVNAIAGGGVEAGLELIQSRVGYASSRVSIYNEFRYHAIRNGVYTKWECEDSPLSNALCKPFEVPITTTNVAPINENFRLSYAISFDLRDGKFVPDVTANVSEVSPGIPTYAPDFSQKLAAAVRTQLLIAAESMAAQVNAKFVEYQSSALTGNVAGDVGLDLNWTLHSAGFVGFEPFKAPWITMDEFQPSQQVFESSMDLFPCQEINGVYAQRGLPTFAAMTSRMYEPGEAGLLRIKSPKIDINPEPFAIEFEFRGSPLPAPVARALHRKLRAGSPDFSSWWDSANEMCSRIVGGQLQPLPPPPTPSDPKDCPTAPGNDAEPIKLGCKF